MRASASTASPAARRQLTMRKTSWRRRAPELSTREREVTQMLLASRRGDATAHDICDEGVRDASAKPTAFTLDDEQPAGECAVGAGRQRAKEVPLQGLA